MRVRWRAAHKRSTFASEGNIMPSPTQLLLPVLAAAAAVQRTSAEAAVGRSGRKNMLFFIADVRRTADTRRSYADSYADARRIYGRN